MVPIVRKRFDHLLSGPAGRRVLGHIEVNQASAVMSKHDQANNTRNVAVGTVKKSIETSRSI